MKKISAYLTILSLLIGMLSTGVFAEETAKTPILHYDFEALDGASVYNTVDNTKYKMGVTSPKLKVLSDTELNYPEKHYVYSSAEGYTDWWASIDKDITGKLNDGFSFSTWFMCESFRPENSLFSIMTGEPNNQARPYIQANYFPNDTVLEISVLCSDSAGNLSSEIFQYKGVSFANNKWHNLGVSFNKATNEPPVVYINGQQKTNSAIKNQGTPSTIPNTATLRLGRGVYLGGNYYIQTQKISYADLSLYDEILSASDLLERYNATKRWIEPQYNISVFDGFGAFVSSENLGSVYKSDNAIPNIKIDCDSISNTNKYTFTTDTVKLYDESKDAYIEYSPSITTDSYEISLENLTSGKYRLEISGIQNCDGEYVRESTQYLEFGIKEETAPTLIANYDMKSNKNTLDTGKYTLGAYYEAEFKKINDYAYTDTYRITAKTDDLNSNGNSRTRIAIDNIAAELNGGFTIDAWAYNTGAGEQCLLTITDNGSSAQKTYKGLNFDSNYCAFSDLLKKDSEDGTCTYAYASYLNQNAKLGSGWNHIVFEYTPNGAAQKIYINGKAYELARSNETEEGYSAAPAAANAVLRFNSDINRNSYTENGMTWGTTWGGHCSRFRFSNISVYTGVSDSFANYLSNLGKENYEASYDLTLYQNDEAVTFEGLNAVKPGSLTAKIKNVTLDKISGNIKLTDGENTIQGVAAAADEGVTVTFDGIEAGKYSLVIDKSVNGRTTDYTLDITCQKPQTAVNLVTKDTGVKAEAVIADKTEAILILAVYASDGTLKGIKTSDVITDDKMETAELVLSETDTAKAMLWNNMSNMTPIVPAV